MLLGFMLALSACGALAPAHPPPHLVYTPGPPVVVGDSVYEGGAFAVRYPRGWRVITAAAFSTPWVVFTTSDETALIVLALDPQDTQVVPANTPPDDLRRLERIIALENDSSLLAVLIAPRQQWNDFLPVFNHMVASVVAPDS